MVRYNSIVFTSLFTKDLFKKNFLVNKFGIDFDSSPPLSLKDVGGEKEGGIVLREFFYKLFFGLLLKASPQFIHIPFSSNLRN